MTEITELKKFTHKGCQVTIRQMGNLFEYLIVYKGRLYSSTTVARPKVWKRWMKQKYSEKDLENMRLFLIKKAIDSIELITLPKDKKSRSKTKIEYDARKKTKLIQGIE